MSLDSYFFSTLVCLSFLCFKGGLNTDLSSQCFTKELVLFNVGGKQPNLIVMQGLQHQWKLVWISRIFWTE